MSDPRPLFAAHIRKTGEYTDEVLGLPENQVYRGIVFHSGTQAYHHADDQPVPFHSVPHFTRFAPVEGPDHFIVYRPGEKPRLWHVVPRDFWYESPTKIDHPYEKVLDVTVAENKQQALDALQKIPGIDQFAYVGNDPNTATALGMARENVEPKLLMSGLDWYRAFKTPYERECIREAARRAARGHAAVRTGFEKGHSERQLHAAYLQATGHLENEVPYPNIIGWDRNAATLHYQSKESEPPDPGGVLLIDAGSTCFGYACDITRTYANHKAPNVFREILDAMDNLQRQLVGMLAPGRAYVDVHVAAHRGVAQILVDLGLVKVGVEEALERQLTRPFLPHGVGHHLGLQVHDVGGHQINPRGDVRKPSAEHPSLRTTRDLDREHVVTIEPGLYFIPMLLEHHRNSEQAASFGWDRIDALIPYGGVRVEDDVLVDESGQEDLTRPFVPGHLEAGVRSAS